MNNTKWIGLLMLLLLTTNNMVGQSQEEAIQNLKRQLIKNDSVLLQNKLKIQVRNGIELSKVDRDSIFAFYESIIAAKNDTISQQADSIANVKEALKQFEIVKFLSIEGPEIFNTRFQKFDSSAIGIRDLEYYELIQNIHEFDSLITDISRTSDTINALNESLKDSDLLKSTTDRLVELTKELKANLGKANDFIDLINTFGTDEKRRVTKYLSKAQVDHYNSLVKQYNNLFDLIYN